MSATETAAATPAHLVIAGGSVGFNWLPVFVAQRQGIFERNGLVVEARRTGSVDKATAAVKSGEADLAITPPEGAIADRLREGNLRIIAGNVNRLPLTLIANPRFSRIEQLEGCKLGTSSLTEGTAIYTMEVLSRHGLHYPHDYSFAVVGVHPARWQALQEGTIDAAVQLIPLNFVAIDAGYANLGEVTDYIPEIVFTALVGRADWLDGHRGEALALLRSLIEATRWLYDPNHEAALIPLVMEITQSDAKYARTSLAYMREKRVFAGSLEIPPAALDKTLELMVKAHLLEPGGIEQARSVLDETLRLEALKN
jgi:ABC-type nitrate/sulfonate/bicarbonate transport system substrate-binding protein